MFQLVDEAHEWSKLIPTSRFLSSSGAMKVGRLLKAPSPKLNI